MFWVDTWNHFSTANQIWPFFYIDQEFLFSTAGQGNDDSVDKIGTSLNLQRGEGRVFMRNVSHVHMLHKNTLMREEEDYLMDVDLPVAIS